MNKLVVYLIAILFICADASAQLSADFSAESFASGARVQVHVTAVSTVLMESDLAKQSSQFDPLQTPDISIGSAAEGVYTLKLLSGGHSLVKIFTLTSDSSGRLRLNSVSSSDTARQLNNAEESALRKFAGNLTAQRVKTAAEKVLGPWIAQNSIGIGTRLVLVWIPGAQVYAIESSASLAASLGLDVLAQVATDLQTAGILNASETTTLKTIFKVTGVMTALSVAGGLAAAAEASTIVAGEVGGENAKLGVRYAADLTQKYVLLLKFVP